MAENTFYKTHVIDNTEIQKGVYILTLPKLHTFRSGQVISLRISKDTSFRMYSLLNGEYDEHYQILYDIHPSGYLTNQLKILDKNDSLYVSAPFGEFLSNYKPKSYLIATGTGIAPFYSLYRSGHKDFTLLQGARKNELFFFQHEFIKLGKNYVRCASRDKGNDIYNGRLTQYIKDSELPVSAYYFICGSAEMVVDVRELLQTKEIPYHHIFTEIYF